MMEAMNLPNAYRVSITHMQSPSCFWVHKLGDSCEELKSLETDLNKICPLYLQSGNQQKPCLGELVAIYHDKIDKWVRGIVIEWKTDGTVFLIDYGYILPKVSQIVRLPERMPPLKPQCFQVFIHGVVPLTHSAENNLALMKNSEWMLPAATKVQRLMSRASSFYFDCFQKWEDVLIGDIYLVFENQSKPLSLTAALCNAELAIVDPKYFYTNFNEQVEAYTVYWDSLLAQTPDQQKIQLGYELPEVVPCAVSSKVLNDPYFKAPQNEYSPVYQIKKCNVVKCEQSNIDLTEKMGHSSSAVEIATPPNIKKKKQVTDKIIPKDHLTLLSQLTGNFVNYGNAAHDEELDEEVNRIISGHLEDTDEPKHDELQQNYNFLQPLSKASYPEAKYAPHCRVANANKPHGNEPSNQSDEDEKGGNLFLERLAQSAVLVKGNIMSKPLRSIREAALHGDILQALDASGVRTITTQQKHMWPAILRGQNIISVGGPLTGKTYGYLAPIASNMLDSSLYKDLAQSIGPLAVVLCPNARKAVTVYENLESLTRTEKDVNLNENSRVKIILSYGGCAEVEKVQKLLNGCHVLVTTPPCFVRIMDFFRHATDLHRLCHLIFDSADALFEKHKDSVDRILAECKKALNVEWRKKRPMQIIVTCQRWNKYIEDFTRFVCVNPSVFISCGLEVLAYCKIPPRIHLLPTPSSRTPKAIELVEHYAGTYRTVVVLNTEEEAMNLGLLLEGKVTNLLLAYDSMDQFSLARVNERWLYTEYSTGREPVLLVTDLVLPELEVSNAKILIHHSLPIMREVFDCRIACIFNCCPDPAAKPTKKTKKIPAIHFLLDCNDGKQTPALVDLIMRMKLPLLLELRQRAEEALRIREEMKSDATFCPNLRNFGFCAKEQACPFRHVVIAKLDDNPSNVPESGEVQLKIMKIHNATHFSARLEKHKSVEGVTTDLMTKEHIHIPMEMKKHYSNPANSDEKERTSDENHKLSGHLEEQISASDNPAAKILKRKTLNISPERKENLGTGTMKHSLDDSSTVSKDPIESKGQLSADKLLSPRSNNDDAHKKIKPSVQLSGSATGQLKNNGSAAKQNLVLHQVCGDLFSAPPGVSLAHTVAEDFIMTKGIARSFQDRFGGRRELLDQRKKVGEVAYLKKGGIYIFYLITKKYTARNCTPTLYALKQSLLELKKMCAQLNVHHIAMPRIGTGINQLQWPAVKEIIETVFFEEEMTISIYQCVVQEVLGNIFSAPYAVSLAHCVAEDLKMTRGIAKSFRYKFGKLDQLEAQRKRVGQVAFLKEHMRFLFYLVTKEESTYDCKPTLESMESCLLELRELCQKYNITRLGIPRIGSGIDHLTWSDVKHLIELIFKDTNVTITVYCLDNGDEEYY